MPNAIDSQIMSGLTESLRGALREIYPDSILNRHVRRSVISYQLVNDMAQAFGYVGARHQDFRVMDNFFNEPILSVHLLADRAAFEVITKGYGND